MFVFNSSYEMKFKNRRKHKKIKTFYNEKH